VIKSALLLWPVGKDVDWIRCYLFCDRVSACFCMGSSEKKTERFFVFPGIL